MGFPSGTRGGGTRGQGGSPKGSKPNVMAVRNNSFNPGMPKGTNKRPPVPATAGNKRPGGGKMGGTARGTEGRGKR